jgi:broad specificity polyphosphatase/5'/3'-nucleotidase SurE
VAFSLALDWKDPRPDYAAAARLAKPVVDAVREHPLPPGVLLNVNIPVDPANARGYRLTRMGLADDEVNAFDLTREEGDSRWYEGRWAPPTSDASGTDNAAMIEGWVAIAPLQLDQTAYGALPALRELDVLHDEAGQLSPVAHLLLWVFPTVLVVAVGARLVWQVRARRPAS